MIRDLPEGEAADDSAVEDALYSQYVRDKIQAGLDSLAREGGIPHEQVMAELAKWRMR